MLGLRLTLVAACLSLVATTAAAQDVETDRQAREAFQQGATAYGQGRFDAALEHFEHAYELSRRPQLLFNIGVSAQRALRTERAVRAFEDYLRAMPEAPNRAEVEERLDTLRRPSSAAEESGDDVPAPSSDELETPEDMAATEPVPPSGEATSAEPTAPVAAGPGALPWIVMGASVAVAAGGGVLYLVGRSDIDEVESVERGSGTTWSDVEGAHDRAPVLTGVGIALMGVGVAGVAVGAILLGSGGSGTESDVDLAVGPSGVAVSGRF